MRVLAAVETWEGSCAYACAKAMRRAGHAVTIVSDEGFLPVGWRSRPFRLLRRLLRPVLIAEYHKQILREAEAIKPDLFFAFKGTFISRRVIRQLRRLGTITINYYPDVSFTTHGALLTGALPEYDWVFTTKSYGVADMERVLGITNSSYLPHGYAPETHKPVVLDDFDHARYRCDASFIGTWSEKKEQLLAGLIALRPDLDLKIWGAQWDRVTGPLARSVTGCSINGREYAKALAASKINIAILSEARRDATSGDQSTTRSFEIPACGGFMLHERTAEANELFEEGRACAMFADATELAAKVEYYLSHEAERARIAAEGHTVSLNTGFSYEDRMLVVIEKAVALKARRAEAERNA